MFNRSIAVATTLLSACLFAANPPPHRPPASDPTTIQSEWGSQTDEEMQNSVSELKREMQTRLQLTRAKISATETNYFLFYSNLPQSEAKKWCGLLDRMYDRLAELFAVPKGKNIWRGKAAIVVFLARDDFLNFEKASYHNEVNNKAGFCHQFKNGNVEVVFYRFGSDLEFARVLTHESTHGFLYRYRSPVHITSWANEGLAEVMEFELVPHAGLKQANDAKARSELHRPKPLDKFFETEAIENFQYPIARTLCEFMIRQNKQMYVQFINGMKDGQDWRESLQSSYGVTPEKLIEVYGQSMGVAGLRP